MFYTSAYRQPPDGFNNAFSSRSISAATSGMVCANHRPTTADACRLFRCIRVLQLNASRLLRPSSSALGALEFDVFVSPQPDAEIIDITLVRPSPPHSQRTFSAFTRGTSRPGRLNYRSSYDYGRPGQSFPSRCSGSIVKNRNLQRFGPLLNDWSIGALWP